MSYRLSREWPGAAGKRWKFGDAEEVLLHLLQRYVTVRAVFETRATRPEAKLNLGAFRDKLQMLICDIEAIMDDEESAVGTASSSDCAPEEGRY